MSRSKRDPSDFNSEIEAHIQLEVDRLKHQGLSDEEARRAACCSFGNVVRAQERFYESGRWNAIDLLRQNVVFGLRVLARNPGFAAITVLTLALGIGANTAIFSLLNAVLLRDLPVQQPKDLVLFGKGRWVGSMDELPDRNWELFSYHTYREFLHRTQAFSDVTAVGSILFSTHGRVGSGATLEKVSAELVSGTFFRTLGVNPVMGRTFTGDDDLTPGAHPVAVASYSWWQRRFAKTPSAVGTTVTIASTIYTIVGVGPPEFFGVTVGQAPDLWIPLAMEKQLSPGWNGLENRLFQSLYVIARLKPGVNVTQAGANTNVLFQQILREYAGPQPSAEQLKRIEHAGIELTPAATGLSQLRIKVSSPLKVLMAVVAVVLLISCANVANLLLARAAVRQREIAIRMSVGAPRSRLIQQLLIESALLGLAGGALGMFLAWGAGRMLLLMVAIGASPLPLRVAPDVQVLGFALAVTLLTVFLFGTVPAFRATRLELAPSLQEGRGGGAPVHNRLARGLVVTQVALSLLLLCGAGLFLHSLANLKHVDTGFDKENVLITGIDAVGAGYKDGARLAAAMQHVEERVAAIPGIRAAGFAFSLFNNGGWTDALVVPGRPKSDRDPDVDHNIVGTQYLRALKMPILMGRDLNSRDTAESRPVAVINETAAREYFPGVSPVGRTFSIGNGPGWQNVEVVGVVRDAKYINLEERPRPAAFYPHGQHQGFLFNFVARYTGDPKPLIPRIRQAVAEIDPNLPVGEFSTLSQLVDASVQNRSIVAQLCSVFGILAALLACLGIYGVMSYAITRRTNEFGIRMALGALRSNVLWMVLRETLRLVLLGVVVGIALAFAAGRLIQGMLFNVKPTDPLALGLAILLMAALGAFAGWLPARRATRIDPISALRYE